MNSLNMNNWISVLLNSSTYDHVYDGLRRPITLLLIAATVALAFVLVEVGTYRKTTIAAVHGDGPALRCSKTGIEASCTTQATGTIFVYSLELLLKSNSRATS